ncbi:hypothetical protein BJY01DRAFT_254425 [Aspergillus pseudoustus]|uniref:Zn(2)-C6 fungal-type domain-containing protein n=1 Tax=Aspergillus pseudoustus TaxID=1810923 RepID=A0ABR4ITB0_9EURO
MRPYPQYRRSPRACIACRGRKVRCDVFVSGAPCTNCRLDHRECVIQASDVLLIALSNSSRRGASNRTFLPTGTASLICSDILYTSYRFIDRIERSIIPADDALFLQLKGCLNVPASKFLRIFVDAYFAHVDPLLPVLNEARFPRVNAPDSRQGRETVSLFVLQSLLFATCSFVEPVTIIEAGFTDEQDCLCCHLEPAIVRVGIDLNIFNILSESKGPLTIDQLAENTGAAPTLLGRILRYLAAAGTIKETGRDTFTAKNITTHLSGARVLSTLYHNVETVRPAIFALREFLSETKYQDITDPTHTRL